MGLNFFDHMALLTFGRGGEFTRTRAGRLAYLPSGAEPHSRRGHYQTGGLAVAHRPYNLGTSRQPHPCRFAFGVPTETVHWVTAAGIRPGVNSVILSDADADADAVAQAAVALA
jgi:hypothetical protein